MELAIQKLLQGFEHFKATYFTENNRLFQQLKEHQKPKILLISCSDSRVDPAIITNCAPGDIFVIRNVANLVPQFDPDPHAHGVSSALEYGVNILQVEHIIVLGHSDCGGIKALMERGEQHQPGNFLDRWLDLAQPAKTAVLHNLADANFTTQCRACEETSILLSIENLMTFPWIAQRVEQHKLTLHGWYFHISSGRLMGFNQDEKKFCDLNLNNLTK